MKLAVIQHSPWEGPGRYLLHAADSCSIQLQIIPAWQGIFPQPDEYSGFILLGGGANIDEEEKYPFLKTEKIFIKSIIYYDKPCLGICLGHQLLANALGAAVGKNFCTSIGAGKAFLTHDGRAHPVFRNLDRSFPTFKWHGQAILPPVPRHFQILATSKECQVEAFSITRRPHLLGVQFDNHAAHAEDVDRWYRQDQPWLESVETFSLSLRQLQAEVGQSSAKIESDFQQIFSAFCCFL